MKDAILFDLDGTLWDSVDAVVRSWNEVFAEHPESGAHLDRAKMCSLMGLTCDEIAYRLMPSLSPTERKAIITQCSEREHVYLRAHGGGTVYDDVLQTLRTLKETYDLYIISNCESGYIEIFLDLNNLWDCIAGTACPGDTGMTKADNIRLVLRRAGQPRAFYLGDTAGDERAARAAEIPFVHAAYGFGQAQAPDAVLHRFCDLAQTAQRIFNA